MMKEKLKTLAIFILMMTSIVLIYELSSGKKIEQKNVENAAITQNYTYTLEDILVPSRAYLKTSDGKMFTVYDVASEKFFDAAKTTLSEILSMSTLSIKEADKVDQKIKYPDIVFSYPYEINLNLLLKSYSIGEVNPEIDSIKSVNSFGIYLYDDEYSLLLSNKDKDYLIESNDYDMSNMIVKFKKVIDKNNLNEIDTRNLDLAKTKNNLLIHDKIKMKIPITYVSNEVVLINMEEKDKLAERFFGVDKYYIRQIKEDNGSVIYFYNSNVLKINPNGLVSYYSPLKSDVRERNLFLSLNTAANFISRNSLFPHEFTLDEIIPIDAGKSKGYKFILSHKDNGLKTFEKNKESSHDIVIEVFNKEIRSFKQIFKLKDQLSYISYEDNSSMLSYQDIIDKNIDYLKAQFIENNEIKDKGKISKELIIKEITDAYPAYFDPNLKLKNERLIPVWVIEAFGKKYLFNVYNGVLMYVN
ncbi:MAG TPA: hypothetical protein PLE17_04185 [Soehngenia sp.]|nr:hypothetical protein [Soehngenia sp.]